MSDEEGRESSVASAAATKIQANFRGYRVRKQLRVSKEENTGLLEEDRDSNTDVDASVATAAGAELDGEKKREADSRKQTEARDDLEEKSATKIQAGVRGFLVRKRQRAARTAATKIQAGFRGFRARKLLKQNGQ